MVELARYNRVTERIGIYDFSRIAGMIECQGKDALDLLHRMSTNDLKPLESKIGGAHTVLTTEKGRILDLVTAIKTPDRTLLSTSAGREETIIQWLDKFTIMDDARFTKMGESFAQLLLVGRGMYTFVRDWTGIDPATIDRFGSIETSIANHPVTLIKWQRIAESGWLVIVPRVHAEEVHSALRNAVHDAGGEDIDDEMYDLLRIEAGIPIAPNELNEKHNPLEAALVSAVSFTKGCYIGQEVIARLDSYDKVQRHLMGLVFEQEMASVVARLPFKLQANDTDAAELTSLCYSPSLGQWIGLAFVRTAYAQPDSFLELSGEQRSIKCKLQKLPFEPAFEITEASR